MVTLNLHPTNRALRQFAVLCAVLCGTISGCLWAECAVCSVQWGGGRGQLAAFFAFAAGGGLWCAAMHPPGMRWLFVGLQLATYPMAFVVSWVVLGALFFGVFGGVAMLLRVARQDSLSLRRGTTKSTYWVDRTLSRSASTYFNQF